MANVIRLNPFTLDFLPLVEGINNDTVERGTNYKYWQLFRPYHRKNPSRIYLANSAQDTYKANFLLNVLLFMFLRILLFMLGILRQNCSSLHKVYLEFKASLTWWSLLVMIV